MCLLELNESGQCLFPHLAIDFDFVAFLVQRCLDCLEPAVRGDDSAGYELGSQRKLPEQGLQEILYLPKTLQGGVVDDGPASRRELTGLLVVKQEVVLARVKEPR